jgi:hypothetical protein
METGGKKFIKPSKTKFRKNRDREDLKTQKQKHHDKSFYRLFRQEENDYVV